MIASRIIEFCKISSSQNKQLEHLLKEVFKNFKNLPGMTFVSSVFAEVRLEIPPSLPHRS